MSVQQGSTAVFQIPEQGVTAGCSSVWCDLGALATEPGVVTAIALVGLLALLAFAHVRDAESACRRERRRVLDERDAFESFADRVAQIDTVSVARDATSTGVPVGGLRRIGSPGGGRRPGSDPDGGSVTLRRVMTAYHDTVLSLPHYRTDYDETAAESLAAELGPDAATALASDGGLSRGARSALVERSRRAADARDRLADAIGEEIGELGDREATLSSIDRRRRRLLGHLDGIRSGRGTDAAIDVWNRLTELERECDELAAERQRSLDDPPLTPESGVDGDRERPFYDYLYGPTDGPRYPVLAQIAEVADGIRADRERVGRRIAFDG
ncbi:hypothetical protein EXE46_03655 [Halorubrum sp. GN11_10-6_MGM]|uniref:DUF7260 family protein n=1 Tax=Halorubrum sp. GN11_10-6_MGM TaxID=2518112 RepID=UPI0010F925AC|nr:hypothetical protein [Halorubrum sp. GN11_10-6_MGM]TKX75554.1 hypothetical protein EXE46_03655 [Halorubrum sp. GN11_10-6_MGM]